ncbi:MAG: hypothetical protein JWR26_621 [Pedosphaera sp.]|nr:hypothetical protein [Pedosphaera sp.]
MSAKNQGGAAMVVLALLVGGMIFSACRDYWKDFWISLDARKTVATIITERSHGVYDYQYLVNGVQYIGQGQRGRTLDSDAHVGGQALVYLSSSHPWLSAPQLPVFSPWNPLVIIAVLIAVEFYIVKWLIKTRKRAPAIV